MALFSAPLFTAWQRGRWWAMVGGAVPFSDAHLYFGGAQRLLLFGTLDDYNSRRPLNAMSLALRLAVTNIDLRLALLIGALLAGAAVWLAVRAVGRDLGVAAGLAVFAGLFGFARVYLPTPMTEAVGIVFGALAFATLWHAVRERHRWLAVGGVFLLTVALDARSGVLLLPFVLPLWLARHLRDPDRGRVDWRFLGPAVVAVAVGASLNYGAVAALGGNTENTLGNGGFVAYGLAKGEPSWDIDKPNWARIFQDHPEVIPMSDPDRNRIINALARDEVRAHPGRFLWASVLSGKNYVVLAKRLILSPVPLAVQRVAMVVGLVVLAGAVRARVRWRGRDGLALDLGLLVATFLAVPILVSKVPGNAPPRGLGLALAAVGFAGLVVVGTRRLPCVPQIVMTLVVFGATVVCLPILGADTVRVFAATAPFAAMPLAFAVAALASARRPVAAAPVAVSEARRWPTRAALVPAGAGLALLATILLGAPVAMAVVDPPALSPPVCADGRPAESLLGGVGVRLLDRPGAGRAVDQIPLSVLPKQFRDFRPVPSNLLRTITGPTTFVSGLTPAGNDRFAIVPGQVVAAGTSVLYLCGDVVHDPLTDLALSFYPVPVDVIRGNPATGR